MIHGELFRAVEADPQYTVKVDLAAQTLVLPDGRAVEFPWTLFEALPAGRRRRAWLHPEARGGDRGFRGRRPDTVNTLTAA